MPVAASEKNEILYEIQNVTQSEDIGFTEIGQGIYLCEGTDGSEYVTGGAEIDLTSEESVNSILSNPYLEQEIKDEVLEAYYLVQNMGQEVECMVYSPDLIPENPEIQPYATIEKYSTYNGLQMKSEIIQLNGLNTGRKRAVAGRGTKNLCSGLKTLVVTALSVAIGEIPVIGSGLSVLQAFNDLYGSNIATGSTEDYLEIGLKYDRCNQFTYCQTSPNIWELGLCSQ